MTGRVIFVGAVHEAVPALGALLDSGAEIAEVVTLPAERSASTSGFVDLEPLAQAHGIAVRRCANINSVESVRHVEQLRPDLMVVTGWTRLLSAELLSVPPRGVIGFHASLLPRYRGRAPVNWAILRGETVTGNTMMYLDAGTDTGDIIDQLTVPVAPDDTCATVYARVGEAGAEMLRLVGVTTGTTQGAFTGDFYGESWLLAGENAGPGVQHFGFLHSGSSGETTTCSPYDIELSLGVEFRGRLGCDWCCER